jgi:hypothetical protein
VRQIVRVTGVCYANVYYHLNTAGKIVDKRFRRKENEEFFNYREYIDTLKERCRKLTGMTVKQFKAYTKTNDGQNLLIRESRFFTPTIYQQTKEER